MGPLRATLPELGLFMALVLVLALHGLAASGHFPAEHREDRARIVTTGSRILRTILTEANAQSGRCEQRHFA